MPKQTLRAQNGREVITFANLDGRRTPAGPVLVFDVPTSVLAAGDYELTLRGLGGAAPASIGYFYFRVMTQ